MRTPSVSNSAATPCSLRKAGMVKDAPFPMLAWLAAWYAKATPLEERVALPLIAKFRRWSDPRTPDKLIPFDARSHGGRLLCADDVACAFQTLIDPRNTAHKLFSSKGWLSAVPNVVPDRVCFSLKEAIVWPCGCWPQTAMS